MQGVPSGIRLELGVYGDCCGGYEVGSIGQTHPAHHPGKECVAPDWIERFDVLWECPEG